MMNWRINSTQDITEIAVNFKDFLGFLTSGNVTLGQGKEHLDTLKIL